MLLLIALFGCPDAKDSAAPVPIVEDTVDVATCEDVDGDVGEAHAENCAEAGGVCVSARSACDAGERLIEWDDECDFEAAEGYCCVPPPAAETGDDCISTGGLCAPIIGCNMVDGWATPAVDCPGEDVTMCCAPTQACAGFGVVTCCATDGQDAYSAACERGELTCTVSDTTLECEQDCPAVDR